MKEMEVQKKNQGWPVNLKRAAATIRVLDKEHPLLHEPFVAEFRAEAEAMIKANGATRFLERLVKAGCPKDPLLYLVRQCENRGVKTAQNLTGYRSTEVKAKIRQMRRTADVIAEINKREFGLFLSDRAHFRTHERLASYLREYAALLEHALNYLGGKQDFYLNLAKAALVDFVKEHTKAFHDGLVAELIASVLDSDGYSELGIHFW